MNLKSLLPRPLRVFLLRREVQRYEEPFGWFGG